MSIAQPVSNAQGDLPPFTIPNLRRDCSRRLALLYREIVLLDSAPDGCFAGNTYLAQKYLKCHPSTVRDLAAILEKHGLIERTIEHGRERHIKPLVPLEALRAQWRELALVCVECRRAGALLRAAARQALKLVRGAMATVAPQLRALPAANSAPLSFRQRGRHDEKASTSHERATDPTRSAAASCLSAVVPESSAQALAGVALRLGRPLEHVRLAVSALKARQAAGQAITNPGGYLRRLIEADTGSLGLPTSPPSHPSERPRVALVTRIVVAPPKPLPPPTDPTLRRLLAGIRQRSESSPGDSP